MGSDPRATRVDLGAVLGGGLRITCDHCGDEQEIEPPAWVISSGRPFRLRCRSCGKKQRVHAPSGVAMSAPPGDDERPRKRRAPKKLDVARAPKERSVSAGLTLDPGSFAGEPMDSDDEFVASMFQADPAETPAGFETAATAPTSTGEYTYTDPRHVPTWDADDDMPAARPFASAEGTVEVSGHTEFATHGPTNDSTLVVPPSGGPDLSSPAPSADVAARLREARAEWEALRDAGDVVVPPEPSQPAGDRVEPTVIQPTVVPPTVPEAQVAEPVDEAPTAADERRPDELDLPPHTPLDPLGDFEADPTMEAPGDWSDWANDGFEDAPGSAVPDEPTQQAHFEDDPFDSAEPSPEWEDVADPAVDLPDGWNASAETPLAPEPERVADAMPEPAPSVEQDMDEFDDWFNESLEELDAPEATEPRIDMAAVVPPKASEPVPEAPMPPTPAPDIEASAPSWFDQDPGDLDDDASFDFDDRTEVVDTSPGTQTNTSTPLAEPESQPAPTNAPEASDITPSPAAAPTAELPPAEPPAQEPVTAELPPGPLSETGFDNLFDESDDDPGTMPDLAQAVSESAIDDLFDPQGPPSAPAAEAAPETAAPTAPAPAPEAPAYESSEAYEPAPDGEIDFDFFGDLSFTPEDDMDDLAERMMHADVASVDRKPADATNGPAAVSGHPDVEAEPTPVSTQEPTPAPAPEPEPPTLSFEDLAAPEPPALEPAPAPPTSTPPIEKPAPEQVAGSTPAPTDAPESADLHEDDVELPPSGIDLQAYAELTGEDVSWLDDLPTAAQGDVGPMATPQAQDNQNASETFDLGGLDSVLKGPDDDAGAPDGWLPSSTAAPPAANVSPPVDVDGMVLRQDGELYHVSDLQTLQRWIAERRVEVDAQLSVDGAGWSPVTHHPELRAAFQALKGATPQAAQDTGIPDFTLDDPQEDDLHAAFDDPFNTPETFADPDVDALAAPMDPEPLESPAASDEGEEDDAFQGFGGDAEWDGDVEDVEVEWRSERRMPYGLLAGGMVVVVGLVAWILTSGPTTPEMPEALPVAAKQAAESPRKAPPAPAPRHEHVQAPRKAEAQYRAYVKKGWGAAHHDPHAAIRFFDRARQVRPNDYTAHYGLGYSMLLAGDTDGALEHLCRARSVAKGQDLRELDALLAKEELGCP